MIRFAAVSMFVFSSTITGHFPPSSSVTGVKFSAAAFATILPTETLPVESKIPHCMQTRHKSVKVNLILKRPI